MRTPALGSRLAAEALGTFWLVFGGCGSAVFAAKFLAPNVVAGQSVQLGIGFLGVALAFGLTVVTMAYAVGHVSGAHFNPVVSLADWFLGRRTERGLSLREVGLYSVAQVVGAVAGSVLANLMFDLPTAVSTKDRVTSGHLVAEVVATTFLLALIFSLARTGRGVLAAPAVGAYIGAAYWFTSSTSFANPAVTAARIFTDTFTGIAPASAMPFILAQLVGAAVGVALLLVLYPTADRTADRAVVPIRPDTTPLEHS